jgi:hypothetical protein
VVLSPGSPHHIGGNQEASPFIDMVGIGVSETIAEALAVIERQDSNRKSKRCRSAPDRSVTSGKGAGVRCCSKRPYRQ